MTETKTSYYCKVISAAGTPKKRGSLDMDWLKLSDTSIKYIVVVLDLDNVTQYV